MAYHDYDEDDQTLLQLGSGCISQIAIPCGCMLLFIVMCGTCMAGCISMFN